MVTTQKFKYEIQTCKRLIKRNSFQKAFDLIWFYWILNGNPNNESLQTNNEKCHTMSGKQCAKYIRGCTAKQKKARELYIYHKYMKNHK